MIYYLGSDRLVYRKYSFLTKEESQKYLRR